MVPEAGIEMTDEGLAPSGPGWFVVNAREARWRLRPGRGHSLPFTGWSDFEAETYFPQVGVGLVVLGPGEPIGMYHWERDQEDFLVLSGEAILIVEGQERPLRQWDFVHCPPETRHMIVGAGDGPCVVLAIGAREHVDENCHGGAYTVDEAALRHGAGVEEETSDADVAYANFAKTEPTPDRLGASPGGQDGHGQDQQRGDHDCDEERGEQPAAGLLLDRRPAVRVLGRRGIPRSRVPLRRPGILDRLHPLPVRDSHHLSESTERTGARTLERMSLRRGRRVAWAQAGVGTELGRKRFGWWNAASAWLFGTSAAKASPEFSSRYLMSTRSLVASQSRRTTTPFWLRLASSRCMGRASARACPEGSERSLN
jgi:uncharacterized cupin superfamily protein